MTSHPRLLITAAQIPTLQSWAVPSNLMYANGFKPALIYALGLANKCWSWSFNGGVVETPGYAGQAEGVGLCVVCST